MDDAAPDSRPAGAGGLLWIPGLLLGALALPVVAAVVAMLTDLSLQPESLAVHEWVELVTGLVLGVVALATGEALYRHAPGFPRWTLWLWVALFAAGVLPILTAPPSGQPGGSLVMVLVLLAGAIPWGLYVRVSDRVARTFSAAPVPPARPGLRGLLLDGPREAWGGAWVVAGYVCLAPWVHGAAILNALDLARDVMGTPDAQGVEGIANAMALRVVCSSLALLVGVIGVWQWLRGGRWRRACAWLLVLLSLVPAVGERVLINEGGGSSWSLVFTLVQCGVVATLLLASPTLRTGPRA